MGVCVHAGSGVPKPFEVTVGEVRQPHDMITGGRATSSFVVSRELALSEAPGAYQRFDQRVGGYTEVILEPGVA
jgi:hypothetical protein